MCAWDGGRRRPACRASTSDWHRANPRSLPLPPRRAGWMHRLRRGIENGRTVSQWPRSPPAARRRTLPASGAARRRERKSLPHIWPGPRAQSTISATALPQAVVSALPPRSRVRSVRSPERALDGADDGGCGLLLAEMLQHHRAGPDHADRVGDTLPCDIRRRAVHRLEHGREITFRVDIARRRDADGAGAGRARDRRGCRRTGWSRPRRRTSPDAARSSR